MEKLKEVLCDFSTKKLIAVFLLYSIILSSLSIECYKFWLTQKIQGAFSKTFENKKNKKNKILSCIFKPKKVSIGDILTNNDTFELKIQSVSFSKKIVPPKAYLNTFYEIYTYMEPKDYSNNILVDVVVDVKNLNTNSVNISEILTDSYIKYADKYEYYSDSLIEYPNGKNFELTSIALAPLQNRKVHIYTEVPKSLKNDDNNAIFYFSIFDKDYVINLKEQNVKKTTDDVKIIKKTDENIIEEKGDVIEVEPNTVRLKKEKNIKNTVNSTKNVEIVNKQNTKKKMTSKPIQKTKVNDYETVQSSLYD